MLPKENNYNNFYCPSLWKELYVDTNGKIAPCCVYDNKGITLKEISEPQKDFLVNDDLSQLHNSKNFLDDRRTVLADKKIPRGCRFCVEQDGMGMEDSQRKMYIMKMPYLDPNHVSKEKATVSSDAIEYLDLRLGNTCNFMCNMCNGKNSHLLAKEAGESNILHQRWNNKKFFKELLQNISQYKNLKFVNVAGGEPFFMKKELLEVIHAIKNKDKINFRIITNTSIYDPVIIEELSKFGSVNFLLSIDAIGRVVEISRWKSNWNLLEKNIKKFVSLPKSKFHSMFVPAISVYTVNGLPDLLEYAQRNNINCEVTFIINPSEQVVNLIPAEHLKLIREKIVSNHSKNKPDFGQQRFPNNISHGKAVTLHNNLTWSNYENMLKQLDYHIKFNDVPNRIVADFWAKQRWFEEKRNYSLKKELPEVYEIIKK